MKLLKTLPAALASIVLGAHFLRAGSLLLVLYCLVLLTLCFVDRPRARTVVRASLVLGVIVWLMTALMIVGSKIDAQEPFVRSLVILLAVAAFTAFAAWLLPPARAEDAVDLPPVQSPAEETDGTRDPRT